MTAARRPSRSLAEAEARHRAAWREFLSIDDARALNADAEAGLRAAARRHRTMRVVVLVLTHAVAVAVGVLLAS